MNGKPLSTADQVDWSVKNRLPRTSDSATASIQAKTRRCIFHQHRPQKKYAEFAVNRVLKTCPMVTSAYDQFSMRSNLRFSRRRLKKPCEYVKSSPAFSVYILEYSIRQSLELFRTFTDLQKFWMLHLWCEGVQTGQPIMDALVTTESAVRESLARLQKND
jgi:hypothetical protein